MLKIRGKQDWAQRGQGLLCAGATSFLDADRLPAAAGSALLLLFYLLRLCQRVAEHAERKSCERCGADSHVWCTALRVLITSETEGSRVRRQGARRGFAQPLCALMYL